MKSEKRPKIRSKALKAQNRLTTRRSNVRTEGLIFQPCHQIFGHFCRTFSVLFVQQFQVRSNVWWSPVESLVVHARKFDVLSVTLDMWVVRLTYNHCSICQILKRLGILHQTFGNKVGLFTFGYPTTNGRSRTKGSCLLQCPDGPTNKLVNEFQFSHVSGRTGLVFGRDLQKLHIYDFSCMRPDMPLIYLDRPLLKFAE